MSIRRRAILVRNLKLQSASVLRNASAEWGLCKNEQYSKKSAKNIGQNSSIYNYCHNGIRDMRL